MLDVANGPAGLVAVGCEGGDRLRHEPGLAVRRRDDLGVAGQRASRPPVRHRGDRGRLSRGRSPAARCGPMVASSTDGQAWQPAQGLPAGPSRAGLAGHVRGRSGRWQHDGERRRPCHAAALHGWRRVAGAQSSQLPRRGLRRHGEQSGPASSCWARARSARAGRLRSRPLALWSADLRRFRLTPFPAQSTRAGGEVNAAAFSADGSLIVAVGATARPVPTVWFSRMATPRAERDRPIDQDVDIDETPTTSPAPEAPATASEPPAAPATEAPTS